MDVRLLPSLRDALKVAGCSIGEDYIPVLYNSLIRLQSENHFDAVYLWGRIVTLTDDYYIAYGYQNDPIKNRVFFYTQNVLEWILMPMDWPTYAPDTVRKIKSKFKGNVRHVETAAAATAAANRFSEKWVEETADVGRDAMTPTVVPNDEYTEDVEEERQHKDVKRVDSEMMNEILSTVEMDETEEMKYAEDASRAETMIKEEDRMAVTVKMIDNESHIVPRGYFYKLPDGNIIKAPYFKGLSYSEIGNEGDFLYVNPRYCPTNSAKGKVRCDYNGSIDFLESIDKDLPKGCWSSQKVMSNRYVIVRNLLWPGAVFVQDMNTGVHGFFYNGDGIKNLDLLFMI